MRGWLNDEVMATSSPKGGARRSRAAGAALILAAIVTLDLAGCADAALHKFKQGDSVPMYANKVGPFSNPRYVPEARGI